MNGFSSILNDVESAGFFRIFPPVCALFFFLFSSFQTTNKGKRVERDSAASVHKDFPNTEGSCPGMCTGVQASSEIMALAFAKENKIDAICRACSF